MLLALPSFSLTLMCFYNLTNVVKSRGWRTTKIGQLQMYESLVTASQTHWVKSSGETKAWRQVGVFISRSQVTDRPPGLAGD